MDDRVKAFSQERLSGRPVPSDVRSLLEAQWRDDEDDPLEEIGIAFLAPGVSHPLVDHSYLNDDDRSDLDIMANVAAIDEVNRYVGYVAEDLDGALMGYWFHPDEPADRPAPVLTFDTEGQFNILPGTTFAEAVVGARVSDDDDFGRLADRFEALGVPMPVRRWADLVMPPVTVDPARLHNRVYWSERARRGLD
jgi:hypothetical protein